MSCKKTKLASHSHAHLRSHKRTTKLKSVQGLLPLNTHQSILSVISLHSGMSRAVHTLEFSTDEQQQFMYISVSGNECEQLKSCDILWGSLSLAQCIWVKRLKQRQTVGQSWNCAISLQIRATAVHSFPLTKSLSSNGLIPKRFADYYVAVTVCHTSGFAVLHSMLCIESLLDGRYSRHSLRLHYLRDNSHMKQNCEKRLTHETELCEATDT